MPERIMFFSGLGGFGGGESFLLSLALTLDAARFVPMLVVAQQGKLVDLARQAGVEVEVLSLPALSGPTGLLGAPHVILTLLKLLRRARPSVVHINDIELGKFVALAARLLGIPVVWTCHGWWYAGRARELFYRLMIDRIATVSTAVRQCLLARGILSLEQVDLIYPGIDTERFSPRVPDVELCQEWGLGESLVVAMIGRFQPIKGHRLFFEAARQVAEVVPEARFLVVGGNVFGVLEDARNRAELMAEIEEDLILRERVRFVEFRPDMPRVLSVVSILVSASEAETFGMIHAEAMACGLPVVSTDSGGPRDIVSSGETGFLVPRGEATALAGRIIELCEHPERRQQMGGLARQRAIRLFSAAQQTRRYEALYEQLGGERS